jgi:hypothetical protein
MMRYAGLVVLVVLLPALPAAAQQEGGNRLFVGEPRVDTTASENDGAPREKAWRSFFEHEGVAFSIIHYQRADARNGGVVLRLENENDYAVRYRLRLAFLSAASGEADVWRSGRAEGVLPAGQMKTGSDDGLFWIPFADGSGIAEIRLPEYRIAPAQPPQ